MVTITSLWVAQGGTPTPTPTPTATATPTATPLPAATPTVVFNVRLDGRREVPANGSTATGHGTVTMTSGDEFHFLVQYSGLTGTVNGMHIHGPAVVGQEASILYDLIATGNGNSGGTSGLIDDSLHLTNPTQSGTAKSLAIQRDELNDNKWYINIHTTAFGGGEIRGQLFHGINPDFNDDFRLDFLLFNQTTRQRLFGIFVAV